MIDILENELNNLRWLIKKLDIQEDITINDTVESSAVISMNYINKQLILTFNSKDDRLKRVPLKETLIHELFHAKQFLDSYPCIIDIKTNYGTFVQSSVLDLFVAWDMVKFNLYAEAERLFYYRVKNIPECDLYCNNNELYCYKLASLKKESELFENSQITKIIDQYYKNNKFENNLVEIFNQINCLKRENKYILSVYSSIIKELFNNRVQSVYNTMLIVL